MPIVNAHAPGTFCWIELGTSDPNAARAFYTGLFGWEVDQVPMGSGEVYSIFKKDGADCAAMYEIGLQRATSHWMSYVAVTDADASTEQAKLLGASVLNGPLDVWDFGRMTVLVDPQGATFGTWQGRSHLGFSVRDEPATLCWNELQARGIAAAKTFYSTLFGWRLKDSPDYTEFSLGPEAVGGMMLSQAPPQYPSHWLPYFSVEDCEGSAQQAQTLGATVRLAPKEVARVGKFSVLADPQGATFAIIQLNF